MFPTITQSHDDELARRIVNSLHARGVAGPDQIRVQVNGGVVVVHARFASAHDKAVCLECCRHVAGVARVVDRIQVGGAEMPHRALPRRHGLQEPETNGDGTEEVLFESHNLLQENPS